MSKDPLERFKKAVSVIKPRIIGASVGDEGTRKTSFWLSAPGPIVVQSFDKGLEGVVDRFLAKGKDIRVAEYEWHPTIDTGQDEAIAVRDEFIEDFYYACKHARTVVWDKETQVWEIFRYAEFGAPNDNPKNYGKLYQDYRNVVNFPKSLDINFGVIQSMKSPWMLKAGGGLTKSKDRVRKGMDEIGEIVHVNIHHSVNETGQCFLNIGKARGPNAEEVQYKTFDYMEFPDFGQLLYPDSDPSDWED